MQIKQSQNTQIIIEQKNISKYTGLLYGRIFLLISLLLLLIVLQPTPFYLFVFLLLCPWIFSNILSARMETPEILLTFCAKKYSYTPVKLTIEKYIGNCTILLFIIWQLLFPPKTILFPVLRLTPGLLLLLYLICRIITTFITQKKIRQLYTELILLD